MSSTPTSTRSRKKPIVLDPTKFYATRLKVYPKAVSGPARNFKWFVLICCLALYYVLPWLRWDRGAGHPGQMVLVDLPHRRFYFADVVIWPQVLYLLAGALVLAAVSLFLITAVVGRVWCGYTCPQTVWTDLFMWVERQIEGDRNERMRRDEAPMSFDKAWRKTAKHAVWLIVAFWTGGAWISYYTDAPTMVHDFWSGTASVAVYGFTFLFTLTTYLLGGWAREQVCTYMCPWPRFQSAMLDEQSLIVTYQGWRGEPRGHGKRGAAHPENAKLGHCVDCNACVHACPTGIDIRDGVQLECINCGLCVDACNEIMVKTDQPKWLVTWDTLAAQTAKRSGEATRIHLLRPRTILYLSILSIVVAVSVTAFVMRPRQSLFVQHDRAPVFVIEPDGALRNGYAIVVVNKTAEPQRFMLSMAGLPGGRMRPAEGDPAPVGQLELPVVADSVSSFRVLVVGQPEHPSADGSQALDFVLANSRTGDRSVYRSVFMGPAAPHDH